MRNTPLTGLGVRIKEDKAYRISPTVVLYLWTNVCYVYFSHCDKFWQNWYSSLGLKDHAIINTCVLDLHLLWRLLLGNHFIVYKLLSVLNVLSKFMKLNSTKQEKEVYHYWHFIFASIRDLILCCMINITPVPPPHSHTPSIYCGYCCQNGSQIRMHESLSLLALCSFRRKLFSWIWYPLHLMTDAQLASLPHVHIQTKQKLMKLPEHTSFTFSPQPLWVCLCSTIDVIRIWPFRHYLLWEIFPDLTELHCQYRPEPSHFSCVCPVEKSCLTLLQPHGLFPVRLLCSWDFPCKDTGVGYHVLLQGIFAAQGLNSRLLFLLHWQGDSLWLSQQGSPPVTLFLRDVLSNSFKDCLWEPHCWIISLHSSRHQLNSS